MNSLTALTRSQLLQIQAQSITFLGYHCSQPQEVFLSNSQTLSPSSWKIVFPLSSGLPFSHYIGGEDSVPLTISVSDSDFFHLTANHPKDAAESTASFPSYRTSYIPRTQSNSPYLSVSVECRGRLTPPLPHTYFGNCSVFVLAQSTDLSGADYGWGELRKFEILHIDYNGAMSLGKSKQVIEVGLSLPKPKMDAFTSIFKKNLCVAST